MPVPRQLPGHTDHFRRLARPPHCGFSRGCLPTPFPRAMNGESDPRLRARCRNIGSRGSAKVHGLSSSSIISSSSSSLGPERRRADGEVVLLLDVMDTLVADPFHWHIPNFFGLSMKELLDQKHPTAWVDFEKGLLTEEEMHAIFFNDGRDFDMQGLKRTMQDAYKWVDGMEDVLKTLKARGVEMHAFTNYPEWYAMIEEKLELSRYLSWTFVSCHMGKRKPDHAAYEQAAAHLGVDPTQCIFVDDRKSNVAAAEAVGMRGVHFLSAPQLFLELQTLLSIPV